MKSVRSIRNNNSGTDLSGRYWRMGLVAFSIFFALACIFARLIFLQIIDRDVYRAMAENQHNMTAELEASRGEIFLNDRDELYPLAVNKQFQMAYAVPKEIENSEEVVNKVSEILSLEKEFLRNKFSNPNDPFEILKKRLTDEEVSKIKEIGIKGIRMLPEVYRYYPGGTLASHIAGFVGSNGENMRGMYGVESFWESELRGEVGLIKQERDAAGRWISVSDRDLRPAKNGENIVLTINHAMQYEVEKILKETVDKHEAADGSIIVMDPKTGKILALASYPNFDPNEYSKVENPSLFNNPTVTSAYEPGSIFKPLTMAIGIDDGKINPDTEFVDNGFVIEAGYKIQNSEEKVYGRQTMTNVLEISINTGVIFVERLVGNDRFLDYVKKFGFGSKTGIGLPAEASGNIVNIEKTNRNINFYTASFGQGISVTPLQIANAYAALANEGRLMKPQIIEKIFNSNGEEKKIEPEELEQVVSKKTAEQVGKMLRSVVINGHGKKADVPGYQVGGKTGTAQVAKIGSSGYEEGLTIGSFAGYAPIQDPQFVVLVKIFDPKDIQWAESTAAPAFGKVMKFLLEYSKVKPTEDPTISPMYKELYGNTVQISSFDKSSVKNKEKKD